MSNEIVDSRLTSGKLANLKLKTLGAERKEIAAMIKLGMMARATDEAVFQNHVQFAHELGLDVIDFL
jgi:hypothetical protein